MNKVINVTKKVKDLSTREREQMFHLFNTYYLGVNSTKFAFDLAEKEHAILLLDGSTGDIVGFSTLMVLDLAISIGCVKAVFSGDTIVENAFKKNNGKLMVELGTYFLLLLKEFPNTPIFWILTSKGCRTYQVLPLFFEKFSPSFDHPTSSLHKEIMDTFGTKKYPEEYDPKSGLIRYKGEVQRLKPGVADVTERRLKNPHTRFFIEKNPEHMRGDDLVCIAEVAEDNFTKAFKRIMKG